MIGHTVFAERQLEVDGIWILCVALSVCPSVRLFVAYGLLTLYTLWPLATSRTY